MLINLCDRCGIPLQGKAIRYTKEIYSEQPSSNFNTEYNGEAYKYTKGYNKCKEFTVCETCDNLIEQILETRMTNNLKLADDCKHIYELTPKEAKKLNKQNKKNENKKI